MSIVQPKFFLVTIAATNKRLSQASADDTTPVKLLAVRVRLKAKSGNTADVRLNWTTAADLPEPGSFTMPADLTDDTAMILAKGTAAVPIWYEFALSAREIENGYYYDLSQWIVNGTAADKLEVIYEPPFAVNIL